MQAPRADVLRAPVDLRRNLGEEDSRSLQQAAAPNERDEVGRWDFGDLPERVEVTSGGRRIAAFPSLVEEAGQVRLKLVDSPAPARERHRRGVCRLLWHSFPDLLKQVEKDLAARLKPAAMRYALLDGKPGPNELLADVLYASARTVLPMDPADLRRQNDFESAAQGARPRLAEAARETARLAAECLEHGHRLAAQLARPLPAKEAGADMQTQLRALISPGFIARTEPARLVHLQRYLKGMERRLDKMATRPERDAQQMRAMAPLLGQWQGRCKREAHAGRGSAEVGDFRRRLGGTRGYPVAQELKTPEPVSLKRLEKLWADL